MISPSVAPQSPNRIGVITAINTTTSAVTLSVDGASVTALRWLAPYSPTVGDMVVVLVADGQWIIGGKLSAQLGSGVSYGSTTLRPSGSWIGEALAAGSTWGWTTATGAAYQGKDYATFIHASVWAFDALMSVLPTGATVTAAKVRLTRWADDNIPNTLAPRIYLHGYSGSPSGPPTWVAGPMPGVGGLEQGETGTWDLPSAWLTALLSGTARGVGIYSTTVSDYSLWESGSTALLVSYSTPS